MNPTWVTYRLQKPHPAGGRPPWDQLHGAPTCCIRAGDQVSGGLPLTHTFITPYKRTRPPRGVGAPHTRPTLRARPSWTQKHGRGRGLQSWLPCPSSWVAWGNWLSLSRPPFLQRKMEGILGKILGERPTGREGVLAITARGRCISGPDEYTSRRATVREHGGALS